MSQSFALSDLGIVGFLVLLEGLLSADNAVILAVMVRHVPPEERSKALFFGLAGAFIFRLVAILLATYLVGLWWLQALGAAYLIYIPIAHFVTRSRGKDEVAPKRYSFWRTVAAVEIADLSFAIDSILAGVAVVRAAVAKIWVVYVGAIIGIVLLRFAASWFAKLLDKYPQLDWVGYLMVLWVGVRLASLASEKYSAVHPEAHLDFHEMNGTIFWSVMALVLVVGVVWAVIKGNRMAGEASDLSE